MTEEGTASNKDDRRGFLRHVVQQAGEHAAGALEKRLERLPFLDEDGGPSAEDLAGRSAGFSYIARGDEERPYFRPPGALREPEFQELCKSCNRCIEVCPEDCIFPAGPEGEAPQDTPLLEPNLRACTLCGECMGACPTGALLPIPEKYVRIGEAYVREHTCIGYEGETCTLCHDACPTEPNAIEFTPSVDPNLRIEPVVNFGACTGCGLCVPACPTEPQSILVKLRPLHEDDLARDVNDWAV